MEYILAFIFWLGLSLIISAIGSKRNIGFFFSFLWSILLSPIIGLAITLFSKPKKNREEVKESILNQLEKINSLKEKNIISETQFENEKRGLTYRLNNLDKELNTSKKPHYIALLVLLGLILIGIFAFRSYWQSKNQKTDEFSLNQILKESNKEESNKSFSIISGQATYASDGIPDYINVFAKNIETNQITKHTLFDRDKGYFEIKIPKGNYYVFSTNDENNITPDKSKIIKVEQGKDVKNVEAQDLYISHFVPVVNKIQNDESYTITLKLLENLADLEQINTNKVEKQLQEFDKDWKYRKDYSSNGEYFFGKQNEVIELSLKGVKYTFLDENTYNEIDEQLHSYVDLKHLKTEIDTDYNKKYWETPYHRILMAEVKEYDEVFGYNIVIAEK